VRAPDSMPCKAAFIHRWSLVEAPHLCSGRHSGRRLGRSQSMCCLHPHAAAWQVTAIFLSIQIR